MQPDASNTRAEIGTLDSAIAEWEVKMLCEALAGAGENQSEATWHLGMSRVDLIKKLTLLELR